MSEQLDYKVCPRPEVANNEGEENLLDMLITLGRHKKTVGGMPVLTGSLALIISLILPPEFTSTAKIMPPQQQSSGVGAMLGQLGGLAGAASGLAGLKNPNDLYVGMLESRTVADNLISRFKLKERYESDTIDDARKNLAKKSEIVNSKKDGLISITVFDKDAQFAAILANAYVEELTRLSQKLAISEASKRRVFFEGQLKEAKDELANSEIALRKTQEQTGIIQPEGQVRAIISGIGQLKGAIAAKEVELKAMRTFATGQNPELLRAQEELNALQGQLAKLERNQPGKQGDFMVPTGKLPEAGIEYIRSLRDVKYYETMFELLAKQYELAKIDEAKDSSNIQVLDRAVPSERKSKPKRALITIAGLLSGGLLGILIAYARDAYRLSRQRPQFVDRWQELMSVWGRAHK